MEPLDIKPGIGIGSAVLGPSRDEICGVFGTPESIDHEDYGDGSSSETWFYCGGDLSLTFCSDEGHRLTFVSVDLEDALLENQPIVGLAESDLSKQLARLGFGLAVLDDDFEENGRDYVCDDDSLSFWVSDGRVVSVSVLPRYDEAGMIPLWPQEELG